MPPVTPKQPSTIGKPIPPAQAPPDILKMPAGFGSGIPNQPQGSNGPSDSDRYRKTKLFWFITIGLLVVAIGILAFLAVKLGQSESANKHKYNDGYSAGTSSQKASDQDAATKASLADTRTYTGPDTLGSFSMEIPKSFSISTTASSGTDKLILLAHPDVVDQLSMGLAFRLTVRNSLFDTVRASYDRDAKFHQNSTSAGEDLQVDGHTAVRYTLKFSQRPNVGTLILVEDRDKTLMLATDDNTNATLLAAYNAIVSSMRVP